MANGRTWLAFEIGIIGNWSFGSFNKRRFSCFRKLIRGILQKIFSTLDVSSNGNIGESDEERETGRSNPTSSSMGNTDGLMPINATDSSVASPMARSAAMYVEFLLPDLCAALRDLVNARAEACEEGFPIPSFAAQNSARRILHYMYGRLALRYEVYPTPDGEIAIDAHGGADNSIVLLCDSDGGAQYFVHLGGLQLFRHCVDARSLPDEFLPIALDTMEREV